MDQSEIPVRHEFVAATGHWVRQLRDAGPPPRDDETGPRRMVTLGHRLSDTLPTYLADRVESFLDEFWTVAQERWPEGSRTAFKAGPLDRRAEALAASWLALKRELME